MKINNFSIDKAKKTQPAFFFGTEEVLYKKAGGREGGRLL